MTVSSPAVDEPQASARLDLAASLAVAVLAGVGLSVTARLGALALLVAVAAVQAVLIVVWVYATNAVGRIGTLAAAALAAAAADVCVYHWPHGRLGTVLVVFALCVTTLFVAQLLRGAARARVVESLGSAVVPIVAVVALSALVQLRHEIARTAGLDVSGRIVSGVVVVVAAGLAVGYAVDLLMSWPRFDPAVPRGVLGVLASIGLGGSLGYLLLQAGGIDGLRDGRGAALGAALGAVAALLAVGAAFVEHGTAPAPNAFGRRLRPALGALVPVTFVAPVAFVLTLAIRTV